MPLGRARLVDYWGRGSGQEYVFGRAPRCSTGVPGCMIVERSWPDAQHATLYMCTSGQPRTLCGAVCPCPLGLDARMTHMQAPDDCGIWCRLWRQFFENKNVHDLSTTPCTAVGRQVDGTAPVMAQRGQGRSDGTHGRDRRPPAAHWRSRLSGVPRLFTC